MAQNKRPWDPWNMYDVSPEELRAIKERGKMREALKTEWTKKFTNPWKSAHNGGLLFDASVQRFVALKNTQAERFRGSFRSTVMALTIFVLPVAFFTWDMNRRQQEKERKYRSGEVKYKDRVDKFFS